jgi:alkylhydroperoxidase family enzyme
MVKGANHDWCFSSLKAMVYLVLAFISAPSAFAANDMSESFDWQSMKSLKCDRHTLLQSIVRMPGQQKQRIPYPSVENAETTGIYGPITNGQRIARHLSPKVLAGVGTLSAALLRDGELDAKLREMIIVRVGYQTASVYEVVQHRSLAGRLGVSDKTLDALACVDPVGLGESEKAAIMFVDELVSINRPTDRALESVRGHYSDGAVLEMIVVAANWWMLARMLETAGVPLDSERIGTHGVIDEKLDR